MFWKRLFNKVSKHGVCHMCDKPFKDKTLIASGTHFFCPLHAKFFNEHSWIELMQISATNENPNNALLIQDTKDRLKEVGINSIIETSYQDLATGIQSIFTLSVATVDYNTAKEISD